MSQITSKDVLDSYRRLGSIKAASEELEVSRRTIRRRLVEIGHYEEDDTEELRRQINSLQNELKKAKKDRLNNKDIRKFIFELSEQSLETPDWINNSIDYENIAVPNVMLSDLHWGEIVDPNQVFNKNEYDQKIAKERLETWTLTTLDFFKNKLNFNYPGIVININGDLISGDIHEELTKSNEQELMQSLLDLKMQLVKTLKTFSENFENVFVVCTPGNHARNTNKKQHKNKAYSNFDWLLYCLLEQWFQDYENFKFIISNTDELQYSIYGYKFRLTHGDQFSGGSGFAGPVNPISRGNLKKKLASNAYDLDYDVLLLGHYHQTMVLNNCIANGSLIGYSEFALQNNMMFEHPKQMVWLIHPEFGVICPTGIPAVKLKNGNSKWFSSIF